MTGGRLRVLILVATVALTWVALAVGAQPTTPKLAVGDEATRDYIARRDADVVDEAATAALREEAAAQVEPKTIRNFDVEDEAKQGVETLFLSVTSGVLEEPVPSATTTIPEPAPTSSTKPPRRRSGRRRRRRSSRRPSGTSTSKTRPNRGSRPSSSR